MYNLLLNLLYPQNNPIRYIIQFFLVYRSRRPQLLSVPGLKPKTSSQHYARLTIPSSNSLLHFQKEKFRLHLSSQNTRFSWALVPLASCIAYLYCLLAWLFPLSGSHVIKALFVLMWKIFI